MRKVILFGRCRNCGKLEKTHYDGREHRRGGSWCYPVKKFPVQDPKYFMRYDDGSCYIGSGKE